MRTSLAILCICAMAVPAMAVLENAYSIQGVGGQATWEDFDGSYQAIDPTFRTLEAGSTLAPGIDGLPIGTAWSLKGNGSEFATFMNNPEGTGPSGGDWGGIAAGFNAGALNDSEDRNLSYYATAVGETRYGRMQYINNSGAPIEEITFRYDHECHWVRFTLDESTTNYGDPTVATQRVSLNGQTLIDEVSITNEQITDVANARRWMDDAEAATFGLIREGVGGIFTLAAPIPDGATFTLQFGSNGGTIQSGTLERRHMNNGMDDIRMVFTRSEADANVDGECNLADLSILATNYNYSNDGDETNNDATWGMADFNADGIVNLADLSILATYYGNDVYAAAAPTPEPATMSLLALGGLALIRRRK